MELLLRGPGDPQPAGRPVQVTVELRNDGPGELWIVGVVDGSEEGARFPRYRPSIARKGIVIAEPPPPEDPLVGPLRAADFHRMAPGESYDPTSGRPFATFATFQPAEPGVYTYTLTLSTESERLDQWLGRFGQDAERAAVLELAARVPRVNVSSNSLEVEIR